MTHTLSGAAAWLVGGVHGVGGFLEHCSYRQDSHGVGWKRTGRQQDVGLAVASDACHQTSQRD